MEAITRDTFGDVDQQATAPPAAPAATAAPAPSPRSAD
jgi:hypothetical protein